MTKDEALDLALEALEYIDREDNDRDFLFPFQCAMLDKAITAVKQARALDKKAENARELGLDYEPVLKDNSNYRYDPPVAEPVAWMYESVCGNDFASRHTPPDYAKNIRPLYTTPPAQPTPEQKRPQNCGTGYCSCVECVMEPAPVQADAWPCLIAEADFEQNTITLKMQCSDYKVGAGQHWLHTTPPAQPAPVQEPVVFYRCNGCGHAYEQVHPTSCDCMEAGGFDRVEYYTTPPAQRQWVGTVDCIGLALDLEAQAKRVESQTVQRTMLAAANGLRIIDKESKT
jgi:hypothetical protein